MLEIEIKKETIVFQENNMIEYEHNRQKKIERLLYRMANEVMNIEKIYQYQS